jgi:hypothetical protein
MLMVETKKKELRYGRVLCSVRGPPSNMNDTPGQPD